MVRHIRKVFIMTLLYTPEDNKSLDESIREKASKTQEENKLLEEQESQRKKIFFLPGKNASGAALLHLDRTVLQPSPKVLLSGKGFEKAYTEQLKKLMVIPTDTAPMVDLMKLSQIFDVANKAPRPLKLTSQSYGKLLPKVCGVLNQFFSSNHLALTGIAKMFKDQISETNVTGG